MKLLLDTHVLIWAAGVPDRLSTEMLPPIEGSLDRLLIAQSMVESITLLTADEGRR